MLERATELLRSAHRIEALNEATAQYSAATNDSVLEWWERRGLTEASVRTNVLGVVDDPHPGHEQYDGWIAIPYLDNAGNTLQIRFRCPWDHDHKGHGKYATVKGDAPRMYNTSTLYRAGDDVWLTEGEIDTISLEQIGLNAVAIPGVHNWGWRHQIMLAGFNRVWVFGDGDQAGFEFASRIESKMRTARAVRVPKGHDANSLLAEGRLQEIISEMIN